MGLFIGIYMELLHTELGYEDFIWSFADMDLPLNLFVHVMHILALIRFQ